MDCFHRIIQQREQRLNGEELFVPVRYCDQCGKRVATSARFCPNCGSEQEVVFVREPIPSKLRFEVLKRDNQTCVYCGQRAPFVVLEVDHVIPVSSGGRTEFSNLVTACQDCNRGKGGTLLDDTEYQEYMAKQEAETELLLEQYGKMNALSLHQIKVQARLDHAFWGYPVISDKENPLYRFLRAEAEKAWQGGKTLLMAMEETFDLLTVPRYDRSSPKARMMQQRFEYASDTYNKIFPFRAQFHELYLQTQFEDIRENCAIAIDAIDETLRSKETFLWTMSEDHWHYPIEAHEDFVPTNLKLEILGVLPRNELSELEDD